MTDYNVTVGKELLPELLSSQNGLAKLVEGILNQILVSFEHSRGIVSIRRFSKTKEHIGNYLQFMWYYSRGVSRWHSCIQAELD